MIQYRSHRPRPHRVIENNNPFTHI
ncbi:hypothetical protein RSAG8_13962, partial [Rhizoctonia solani AG-8 WAC10335]